MLNIGTIIGKFIRNSSQRELSRLKSLVEKINGLETKIIAISDQDFPSKTMVLLVCARTCDSVAVTLTAGLVLVILYPS